MCSKRKDFPLEPFNDTVEPQDLRREWEEWHRAFELLMELRNFETEREKFVFLLSCGGRGLQRIFQSLGPTADEIYPKPVKIPLMPTEVPEYDNAVKRFNKFFIGKRNERVGLELFRSLRQKSEESFNQFVLRLRDQAARCDFGERVEKEILQQITIGAWDEKVRDKGLENVMELDEVINYALNREILIKQKGKFKPFGEEYQSSTIAAVNLDQTRKPRVDDTERQRRGGYNRSNKYERGKNENHGCMRCGLNHTGDSQKCYARDARCNHCNKLGHYARVCRNIIQSTRKTQYRERNNYRHELKRAFALHRDDEWKEELPSRCRYPENAVKVDDKY